MADLISRQAAIDAMCVLMHYWFGCDSKDEIREIKQELGKLPSAQPERKKGEWISLDDFRGKYNEFGYKCSECGIQNDYQDNFCPNCGAEMKGENNV